jgi:hypothetical protein
MPDTGAPWNIPYVDDSDLVRDFPTADEAQALAIAAGLSAAGNAGIGDNAITTLKDDTFSTSSASYTDVTGLAVTITPTTDTSKVLLVVTVSGQINGSTGEFGYMTLLRGSTSLISAESPGSRTPAFVASARTPSTGGSTSMQTYTMHLIDSPGSSAPITYKVQARVTGNTLYVNRTPTDTDSADYARGVSSITAIEVKP